MSKEPGEGLDCSRCLCRATGEGFHGFIYNSYTKILLNSSMF